MTAKPPVEEQKEETPDFNIQVSKGGSLATTDGDDKPLIPDQKILDFYEEAIENIRADREQAQEVYENFSDMVLNEGDPSAASKEALISALKIKSDSIDKMVKILDLWTRMKMKEKATSTEIYAYQQNNKYDTGRTPNPNIRKMIQNLNQEPVNDAS